MRNPMAKHGQAACRAALMIAAALMLAALLPAWALADEVTYTDTDKKNLDNPDNTYVIKGDGVEDVNGNYFTVPDNKSSESEPIVIILDNVNRSQAGKSPDGSFIKIGKGNYVIVKLRGANRIVAGEDKQVGSNDGMAGIHVSAGSTVKVTSEAGDGLTDGSLEVHGGGVDRHAGQLGQPSQHASRPGQPGPGSSQHASQPGKHVRR